MKEHGLQPPQALLEELVRQAKRPPGAMPTASAKTMEKRERFFAGDPVLRQEALDGLAAGRRGRLWYVFEGNSYPDVFIETPDALIIIEGKYTESGATTRTSWMPDRHQMLHHLDGAWEIRGDRSVYGLFIVDGESNDDPAVPKKWLDAAASTVSPEVLENSMPHRKTSAERQQVADCFVGITTWQATQRRFGLNSALLTPRKLG